VAFADRQAVGARQVLEDGICFGLLNVRSVAKRSIAVSDIITSRRLDVFTLTETWHQASDDLSLKRCAPPGYSIIDAARCQTETRGGGVALIHSVTGSLPDDSSST